MSQEQLAEKLNVSRQSVSKWERDEALPDIYNLEAISEVFGVSTDYIIKQDIAVSDNEGADKKDVKQKNKKKDDDPLFTIFSSIALIIIIISGFGFGIWYPTVILMPISGFLALIIITIKKNRIDKTIED